MKRSYLIYGAAAGLLLVVLQAVHYKAMIRDLRIEVFGVIIAIIFMAVGIFVGIQIFKRSRNSNINKQNAGHLKLSDRELEVLDLLATGLSNQEIADKLFVSLNTVKTHLSNLYQKLSVTRRTQAIQKARELSILKSPESTKF
ncbi:MAG: LuxR C-terminal-related transcriptional regulator [Marinoscillum sp.]